MNIFFFGHAEALLPANNLWQAWSFEPSMLIPLIVTALIYIWGVRNVWQRAGVGHGISWRRGISFLGAMLALIVALVSPLDALSAVLFSAHMIQHLVLILIAAPLLVICDFQLALLWALPRSWAKAIGRGVYHSEKTGRAWHTLSSPVMAWVLFTVAIWAWHAPLFFEAALRSESIHAVEHLVFLGTAMLFWWVLMEQRRSNAIRYGIAIPYLFATGLQSGLLGALMTFTTQPWYAYYAAQSNPWGLTALQDQQLAGLIMWVPGGVVFSVLTIGYFGAWLQALEERSVRS